jgi:hypothetical protein
MVDLWKGAAEEMTPSNSHASQSSSGAPLAIFAEFERVILRARTRAGLAHSRENGTALSSRKGFGGLFFLVIVFFFLAIVFEPFFNQLLEPFPQNLLKPLRNFRRL